MQKYKKTGFSLIELAAVVMVIAFLISGISVAYSMIKQASLRSIISEANTFTDAINLFEQKYKSLPGDFSYASVQWGTACDSTPSNCNGDGDGMISYSSSLLKNESMRVWQHLSLAGMISGSYTGIATVAGQTDFGINGPASAYSAAGWSIFSVDPYGSPYPQGQYLQIGGFHPGGPSDNPLLFPTDAYVVDNKIDDGYPRRGLVYADFNDCYSAPKTLDSLYNYDLNSQVCILKFIFRK